MTEHLTKNNFWDTDLSDIESTFLPSGQKVTDLPIQGSILLNKVVNADKIIPKVTFVYRMRHYFKSICGCSYAILPHQTKENNNGRINI